MKEKIIPLVEQILREDARARDDYLWLWLRVGDKLGMLGFIEADNAYQALRSLPHFTTVERAKRRVVDHHPELAGTNKKRNERLENEYRSVKGNVDKLPDLYF